MRLCAGGSARRDGSVKLFKPVSGEPLRESARLQDELGLDLSEELRALVEGLS
jgi:hypothetical protein